MIAALIFFGQYGIFLIIAISIASVIADYKSGIKQAIALALSLAISYGLSSTFYVPRPFVKNNSIPLIPHEASSSFPSHHASAGFALAFSTLSASKILGIISSAIAVLMSIGRVYAGLHSGIDIIGGLIIGVICAIFAYSKFTDRLIGKIIKKSKIKKHKK